MVRFTKRGLIVLALAVAGFCLAPVAGAQEGETDGGVYLIISLDDTFVFQQDSEFSQFSQTILLNIGTMVGGATVVDTRFVRQQLSTIPLPGEFTFADLAGNELTVLGTFETTGLEGTIHLVSPVPDDIPAEVQAAVHTASLNGDIDALASNAGEGSQFPDTYDIASAVHEYVPYDPETEQPLYTVEEVAGYLFNTPVTLTVDENAEPQTAGGEGDLFPHEPGDVLFQFAGSFDEDGNLEFDVCLVVGVDVKPGSTKNNVNLEKDGKLKIAFLSSDSFDATGVDADTAEIGGVSPLDYEIDDVNDDGLDDIVLRFDVNDLTDAGALTASSTELTMTAELTDGTCVQGTDSVDVH